MTTSEQSMYDALEKIFHEPNRLAIMSSLCASEAGLTFTELKVQCGLTDGNLNRHLKVLREADAVLITKRFIDEKPQTSISLSDAGVQRFEEYLSALSNVLETAKQAMPSKAASTSMSPGRPAEA